MPSTFLGLNISYTGLVASNSGLNTTANNISNIETKGFSRQQVNQVASDAIRTFTSYGCVGAGVDTLSAERIRDIYYDEKYWNNNSKLGEFGKKQYYAALVENYLQDTKGSNAVQGFTTIFDNYSKALEDLSTHTGDSNYALTFIGQAGNLCEYFNLLYGNFQQMQTDVNDEIKIQVDQINGIASQITSLNKQINTIEIDGNSIANELRDKRDLLIDELSEIVDVRVEETEILAEATGQPTGAKEYTVKIAGGQTLVDGYNYRVLKCIPRETYQTVNQNDVEGLYDIVWTDTNEELGVYAKSTQGALKGLYEMRDGNNDEGFHGKVAGVDAGEQSVRIKVTDDYLTDMSKSTLPLANGCITIGGEKYIYESWSFEATDDGEYFYTFKLSQDDRLNPERITTAKASQEARVGEQVNYQGLAYYMEQMNEWVRDYASAFNKIYGQEGAMDFYEKESCENEIFFTGDDTITGEQFDLSGVILKPRDNVNSMEIGYYYITAGNFNVRRALEKDPKEMVTHTVQTDGISKYDVINELKQMAKDPTQMQFRGCKAADFLICVMGDAALNAQSANNFQGIYEDISNTIENNRISISGVDADEEAANMITYQNAFKLSSKMIQVLSEVYDKLIQQTGV